MNKPNIIYIFADQLRRQAIGSQGEDEVMTPFLDEFAGESSHFLNAVSCYPVCSPHRASLLTGQYPVNHGVVTNCKPGLNLKLKPETPSIGNALKQAGYSTGYIGKWHLDEPEINHNPEPLSGAKDWDAYTPPGPRRQGFDFWYSYGACDDHMNPHYWMHTPEKIQVKGWSVEHETHVAINYIKEQTEPFALFLSWNPPHTPFDQVPERYRDLYRDKEITLRPNVRDEKLKSWGSEGYNSGMYDESDEHLINYTRDYFAAITGVDEHFGKIIECLKNEGLYDNAIIVFSSDHGEMLGSHGLMNKLCWYEESVGIPFIIRYGSHSVPGQYQTVINTVDHMPTILSLAGVEIPSEAEGTDLSSVILKGEERDNTAFLMACEGRASKVKKMEEQGIDMRCSGWRGIRTENHLYIVHREDPVKQGVIRRLYDLKKDPYQLRPEILVHCEENSIAEELEKKMISLMKATDDPFLYV